MSPTLPLPPSFHSPWELPTLLLLRVPPVLQTAILFWLFFFSVFVRSSLALITRNLRVNKPLLAGNSPGYLSLCLKEVVFVKILQRALELRVWSYLEARLSQERSSLAFPPVRCSNLSSNHLSRLEESSFAGLSLLQELHVGSNRVSFIADGAFRGLSNLQML